MSARSEAQRAKRVAAAWREGRQAAGLSQTALAKKLGISSPYLSLLEQGKRTNPSTAVLGKMAEISGVSTDRLLGLA